MPKIANNGDGSALMRDIPLAGRIIRAVADAVSVPVTVKTRLGWDRSCPSAVALARAAEENGAAAITIPRPHEGHALFRPRRLGRHRRGRARCLHPRYRKRRYLRPRAAAALPGAQRRFAVHGGTRRLRRPWLFERLRAALRGKTPPELPPLADRVDTALQQFALALEDKGEHIACLEARKHFAWYLRGVPHSGFYKEQISNISAFSDIERLAKEIKRDLR